MCDVEVTVESVVPATEGFEGVKAGTHGSALRLPLLQVQDPYIHCPRLSQLVLKP